MKNLKLILTTMIIILLIVIIGGIICFNYNSNSDLTESQAISILKNKYSEFSDYPSDKLAPKSIKTEKADDGWYAAFVQEGSGRPIISAKCFLVKANSDIMNIGEFKPEINDSSLTISPTTCR